MTIAVAVVYFASAKLGLALAFATENVTAVWPPAGIALAVLVLGGRRLWPGVALGAFVANATTDVPVYTAAGIAVGNTLEAFVGAWLLERARFRPSLARLYDVVALALAALLSTTISATIGLASLGAGDSLSGDVVDTWRVWWLGDTTGDLLVASWLFVLVTHWPHRDLPGRGREAVALGAALAGVGVLVFSAEVPSSYVLFPLVAWASIRFLQLGATTAPLLLATIAVTFTANEAGPFVRPAQDDSLLLAQGFAAVTALTALILAAVTSERMAAERRIRRLAHDLQAGLMPPHLPEIPHFDLAAWYRAGAREQEVGGDFYDVFEAGPGRWMVVIGDVCGKGAEAASLTALARYTLRAVARRVGDPSETLRILNDEILEQRTDQRFMTATVARLQASESDYGLTICHGGHHPALLLRADGEIEDVGLPGSLLGIYPDPQLADERLELRPGETLVLFTDGLIERRHPTEDRRDRIRELLRAGAGADAGQLVAGLEDLARGDGGDQDDVAVLVLRRRPAEGSRLLRAQASDTPVSIELEPDENAPAAARAALETLRADLDEPTLGDLRLLVSELVTNSIRHAGLGPADRIRLRAELRFGVLRVDVSDCGGGFEPVIPQPSDDLTGGWGLFLIERLADRWGVERAGGETHVWFEKAVAPSA